MYLLAFLAFWLLGVYRIRKQLLPWERQELSDLIFYGVIGVVLGGRLGYVLFYNLAYTLDEPLSIFKLWEGGMSFHGGLVGVIAAGGLWCWLKKKSFWETMDGIAPLVPIGLGLGRVGNFINTELPGRATDSFLGVHFPCDSVLEHNFLCTGEFEHIARHVSSLYQAFAEGLLLFLLVWLYASKSRPKGNVAGFFLLAYGVMRIATEMFREPDAHLGFVVFGLMSMGQALSLLMVVVGVALLIPITSKMLTRRPAI